MLKDKSLPNTKLPEVSSTNGHKKEVVLFINTSRTSVTLTSLEMLRDTVLDGSVLKTEKELVLTGEVSTKARNVLNGPLRLVEPERDNTLVLQEPST